MNVIYIILQCVLGIICLALIVLVLMQQGRQAGLGAIAGGAETFFGKQKAKSYEGRMASLTRIAAVVFFVLSIVIVFVQKASV